MSKFKEDSLYEMFSFINSNERAKILWENNIKEISKEKKYMESFDRYELAFEITKKQLNDELYK